MKLINPEISVIIPVFKAKNTLARAINSINKQNINNDKKLNSFISNCSEEALKKAKSFDKSPKLDLLLPGIPIAVKDLFCTQKAE